ncbi:MAG: septum site-determining protein MinC [Cyanobacteria bacterium M5B4]|nr:MAG: septum site-determining protein MinC [Cyanobacteria bacterium M5B4]
MEVNSVSAGEFSLQGRDGYLHLTLPIGNFPWEHFLGQLHIRLESPVYRECGVILTAGSHAIDAPQLEALGATLRKHHLHLHQVVTDNRSTAIVAATLGLSVDQPSTRPAPDSSVVEPLYLTKIIRSGVIIRHPGSVILRGDLHPGGEIVAGGDILVWGKLRGKAHTTNPGSSIMALELAPTQLKIGATLCLVEANPRPIPEVAYLDQGTVCITPALEHDLHGAF